MSTKDNKSGESEVQKDKTEKTEVTRSGPITDDDIANDIVSPDSGDDKKESKSEPEKTDDKSKEKSEDDTEEEEADKEGADDKTKSEDESDEEDEADQPFAKVGSHVFKTKEDLLKFASSQTGYNTWMTGQLKKLHPELFNADGSIKTKELSEKVDSTSKKASDAAETIKEHAGKEDDEMSDEEKADVEKAKKILKRLGVVFADDPEYKTLNEHRARVEEEHLVVAKENVQQFLKDHPLIEDHREAVADLMDARGYTSLEKAWNVYKVENDIEEEVKDDKNKGGTPPRKPVDTAIPSQVSKGSGNAPSKAKGDFMDDILAAPGML